MREELYFLERYDYSIEDNRSLLFDLIVEGYSFNIFFWTDVFHHDGRSLCICDSIFEGLLHESIFFAFQISNEFLVWKEKATLESLPMISAKSLFHLIPSAEWHQDENEEITNHEYFYHIEQTEFRPSFPIW